MKEVFTDVPATKGIARFHYLTIEYGRCVPFVLTNDAVETSEEMHLPADEPPTDTTEEEPIHVGDWWVVEYDDELFPGEVK